MKEEVVAKGIVLKVLPYKENDCILTIYFEEYGKLSVIATGLRKPKSKNASACQPLMYSEFTLFLRQGLSRLIRAVALDEFRYLHENLQSTACATLIAEYYYRGIEENQPSLKHSDFMMQAFKRLNEGYPPLLVYLFAIAFILKDCGSAMMVDHCVFCDDTHQIVSLSIVDGGFVCLAHVKEKDPFYAPSVLRVIRYVNRLGIEEIDVIDADEGTLVTCREIMENFLEEYCPIRLESRKFV